MARSVIITTPIPTLEEWRESLGISKRRQAVLLRLMQQDADRPRANRRRAPAANDKAKVSKRRSLQSSPKPSS